MAIAAMTHRISRVVLRRTGRYVFAVLVGVLAALLRHGLTGFFGNKTFYITFYPAVMVVATLAGFGPGVLATAVAALIADYWILPPTGQFMGKDISDIVSLGGFAFMGVFMSVVAGLYRASRDKAAEQERKVLEEVVEKERDFSSAVLAIAGALVVVLDRQGRIVRFNRACEQLTGYSFDEVRDRVFSKLFLIPEEVQEVRAVFAQLCTGQFPREHENYLVTRDHGLRLIRWSDTALCGPDGSVEYVIGTGIDFTELRQAAEALKRAHDELEMRVEERTADLQRAQAKLIEQSRILEGFFTSTITPLVFLDRDFNFIRVNEAYATSCRKEIADFPGHNHFEFYPHEENEAIFRKVVETKVPYQAVAKPFVFPDHPEWGTTYWDWTLTPLSDASGEVEFLVFSLEDVTERKRAEQALALAGVYNRSLIEASLDPLVTINPEGKISDVNTATELATGHSRQELIGTDFSDYFAEPQKARAGYQMVFNEGLVRDYPLNIRHRDGHITPVLYNASVYRDDTGSVVGVFAAARDVSEQQKLESQLRQAQKLEALGTLAGGIAHDFNNILAAIIGFTEMIYDHVPKESRQARHAQRVLQAGMRGRELVRQMLTFSRRTEEEKKPLQLSSIVKETVKLLRPSIPSTISIRVSVKSESGLILGDSVQIQQVLMYLATNAAQAMREKGGVLDVELSDFSVAPSGRNPHAIEPGAYMKLLVRDTGIGMPPEVVDKIFDPFFTTKGLGEGTGLGLSVVLGIVKQAHGYITVDSEPGKGSTFTVYFPKVAEELATEPATDHGLPTGSERILFVDDEEALLQMGEELLAELGYEVVCRMSSREALSLVKDDPSRFDLVITDQTMPDMTGFELAREILAVRPDMPVILATGFSSLVNEDSAREAGIKAFVMKPLTKKDIATTIREVL